MTDQNDETLPEHTDGLAQAIADKIEETYPAKTVLAGGGEDPSDDDAQAAPVEAAQAAPVEAAQAAPVEAAQAAPVEAAQAAPVEAAQAAPVGPVDRYGNPFNKKWHKTSKGAPVVERGKLVIKDGAKPPRPPKASKLGDAAKPDAQAAPKAEAQPPTKGAAEAGGAVQGDATASAKLAADFVAGQIVDTRNLLTPSNKVDATGRARLVEALVPFILEKGGSILTPTGLATMAVLNIALPVILSAEGRTNALRLVTGKPLGVAPEAEAAGSVSAVEKPEEAAPVEAAPEEVDDDPLGLKRLP